MAILKKGGTQLTAPQKNSAVFTSMQYDAPNRNAFNLSKQTHGTLRFGKLYPVYSRMVFSGDSFKIKPSHFIRFASVISPILNKISITYSAFYVPFRLVWKFFPTFISGGYNNDGIYTDAQGNYLDKNDNLTTTPFKPEIPTIDLLEQAQPTSPYVFEPYDGSLLDWLGYPTFPNQTALKSIVDSGEIDASFRSSQIVNALPLMCYHKVVKDWFTNNNIKDESLLNSYIPPNVSGLQHSYTSSTVSLSQFRDISGVTQLSYVNYGLDYFTSALPYLQRGEPILLNGKNNDVSFDSSKSSDGSFVHFAYNNQLVPYESTLIVDKSQLGGVDNSDKPFQIDNSANLSVQLGTTIQELRFANALQEWAEKSLRVGTRYIDFLKAFFGVNSSDRSLQRSEYLGSSVHDVSKFDIDQTSGTEFGIDEATPQGTTTTKLIASASSKSFDCYCEEHGMIFVMAYVTPETIYKNRIRTEYLYKDKEDFLFPEFAHLSPQAVQNQELFVPRDESECKNYRPTNVFGYQDRYNELRQDTNDVHGDFKGNLSFFLQMRNFTSMPALNTQFLKADDVSTSIFATNKVKDSQGFSHEVDQIWASFDFDVKAIRCLPKIAIPQLV
ncbi:major capsid protein [Microvirus sp.]|nr:major capsid protein [Microvirus sp.]